MRLHPVHKLKVKGLYNVLFSRWKGSAEAEHKSCIVLGDDILAFYSGAGECLWIPSKPGAFMRDFSIFRAPKGSSLKFDLQKCFQLSHFAFERLILFLFCCGFLISLVWIFH